MDRDNSVVIATVLQAEQSIRELREMENIYNKKDEK